MTIESLENWSADVLAPLSDSERKAIGYKVRHDLYVAQNAIREQLKSNRLEQQKLAFRITQEADLLDEVDIAEFSSRRTELEREQGDLARLANALPERLTLYPNQPRPTPMRLTR